VRARRRANAVPARDGHLRNARRRLSAGMPPIVDPSNLYSETGAGKLDPNIAADPARVYVPNLQSNDVYVIDPATLKVVDRFKVGLNPQHVVPSWDLRTLWVANNAENTNRGSLTPVDPKTGKPGKPLAVDDPYNMYFSPDGKSAIIVAEAKKRLDFRDRRRWSCSIRSRFRAAPASIMRTSRSTGAGRSSPASSRAPSPRSISSTARCSGTRR
jgi:YVTN family beta-propeller protein